MTAIEFIEAPLERGREWFLTLHAIVPAGKVAVARKTLGRRPISA